MLSSTGRVPPTSVQAVHTPAGGVPSALANLPAGTLITGTATGRDAAGQTLLRTDTGTLALATRLYLDRGSVVILRIRGGPTFSATIVSVDGRPPPALPLAPPPAAPASPGKPPAPTSGQTPGPAPTGLSAPPGPKAPAAASGAPGAPAVPLMAAVAGTDGGGRPLLNLPFGTVRIETPASVPTGTTPALTVLGVEPEAPPPMPDGARREIRAIFDDGLAVGGLAGTLSIQVAGSFPVVPLEEIVAGERSGVLA